MSKIPGPSLPYRVVFGADNLFRNEISIARHASPQGILSFSGYYREAATLQEARRLRSASGDLCFDSDGNIVQDPAWLWAWETTHPDSYARKMQDRKVTLKVL